MRHTVLHKRKGYYTGWPLPSILPDGRLVVAMTSSPWPDHYALGDRIVLVSDDEGDTWIESDDSSIPSNWPSSSTREAHDRFEALLPDGRFLTVGGVGWEIWPSGDIEKANSLGLHVSAHPNPKSSDIVVGGRRIYVQFSKNQGKTWSRREWAVPRAARFLSFPRPAVLHDGTILVPGYDIKTVEPLENGTLSNEIGQIYVIRITKNLDCELIEIPGRGGHGDEFAMIETSPGTVLALIRDSAGPGYLLESWSHDGGRTWSHALQTEIWGYPPHLLSLSDGRILCSYGHRRDPMGVRAVISNDGGRSWDLENAVILRDDAVAKQGNPVGAQSPSDIGYPISVQLTGGDIFTAYYFTAEDGIVHTAATRWQLD